MIEVGKVLEIVGAKGGNRTPTGVSPQDPESCASTKFRHFRVKGKSLRMVLSYLRYSPCQGND